MAEMFDDYELFQLMCEAKEARNNDLSTEATIRFLSHPNILHYKEQLTVQKLYLALSKGNHTSETSQELQRSILEHPEATDIHLLYIACHGHTGFCEQAFDALCKLGHELQLAQIAKRGRTESLALKGLELLSKHPDMRIRRLAEVCVDARTPNVAYKAWCKIKESSELDGIICVAIAIGLKSQPNPRIETELAEIQKQRKSEWEAVEKSPRPPREIPSEHRGYASSRDGW